MRSLSNLYKQWYIQPQTMEARIIDSNPLVDSCLARQARRGGAESGADGGFAEGLAAAAGGTPGTEEPQADYIALAKTEAVRLIEDAKRQAAELVAEAEARSAEIEESAKQDGYQAAEAMIAREKESLRQESEQSLLERSSRLEQEYALKREKMEAELVDVILTVFNRVFHIQFDEKKEILLHLVTQTLMNVGDEKRFRVRAASDRAAFLEGHRGEILDQAGHDIELEILSDASMKGNGCVIETDSGVFDCGSDTQLENLIRDIRSLCS